MNVVRPHRAPVVIGVLILIMTGTAALTVYAMLRWRRADDYAKARELIDITYDKNVLAQWDAADELARMGVAAVPALRHSLYDENERTRFWAVYSLGKIGHYASESAPDLLAVFTNSYESFENRRKAAKALAQIGPSGKQVVPDLVRLLKDPLLGPYANHALQKIAPEQLTQSDAQVIQINF